MKKVLLATLLLTVATSAAVAKTGKEIYESSCIACHGADGKGAVPGAANFTDPKGPTSKSDKDLVNHIMNGYQSPGSPMAMPAKGGNANMTEDEAKDSLKYIRDTFEEKKK